MSSIWISREKRGDLTGRRGSVRRLMEKNDYRRQSMSIGNKTEDCARSIGEELHLKTCVTSEENRVPVKSFRNEHISRILYQESCKIDIGDFKRYSWKWFLHDLSVALCTILYVCIEKLSILSDRYIWCSRVRIMKSRVWCIRWYRNRALFRRWYLVTGREFLAAIR